MDLSPVGAKFGGRPSLTEVWDVQDGVWNHELYGVYGVVG